MGIYLGIDASTQSLSALAIDTATGQVALDTSINFGADLPQYRSPHGVLPSPDRAVQHSDPLMWTEALDRLLERVRAQGFDLSRVEAISGAGQQHGSVYLRGPLSLSAQGDELKAQLGPQLSRKTAPMWMDSSTSPQCQALAASAGGAERVLRLTGSIPIERFTGPQIMKFWNNNPEEYRQTERIHLVSSFMASLLIGSPAPIDRADGAGMNLLELSTGHWHPDLLAAVAPDLEAKLAPPVDSTQQVGTVHPYFEKRYGLRAGVPVFAFTGDNPSSLVGLGATEPGSWVISLGTSDTVFCSMPEPRTDPRGYGHVFGNPMGGFMSLTCFANGSLARERVASRLKLNWEEFAQAIEQTPAGAEGCFMLPWFAAETTPRTSAGPELVGDADFMAYKKPALAARAVVESQALLMRIHCDWLGQPEGPLKLAGGASANRGIRQVLADVFQRPVTLLSVTNASALGAALRAASAAQGVPVAHVSAPLLAPQGPPAAEPNPAALAAYGRAEAQIREAVSRRLGG